MDYFVDEISQDLKDIEEQALHVLCLICGAYKGEKCISVSGPAKSSGGTHVRRLVAGIQLQKRKNQAKKELHNEEVDGRKKP